MSDDISDPVYRPFVPHKPEQRLSICVQRFLNRALLPPRYFTDYLCFFKIEGKWQVAQKIFATEVRE